MNYDTLWYDDYDYDDYDDIIDMIDHRRYSLSSVHLDHSHLTSSQSHSLLS